VKRPVAVGVELDGLLSEKNQHSNVNKNFDNTSSIWGGLSNLQTNHNTKLTCTFTDIRITR
jgi:hypothetical protein